MESESEDEAVAKEPRLRGALRGLDRSNMLAPSDRRSLGAGEGGRQSTPADTPQHETRASRHGKIPVNYSAKWHPMDEVIRPKRARTLENGSTSRRAINLGHDSELESFSGGGTDEDDDEEDMPDTPFKREPDAGATRRSDRSEARKPVNYSKAHHPQDHLLPGYRHRSKRQRRSRSVTKPRKTKASSEPVVLSSQTQGDSGGDGGDGDDGGDKNEGDYIDVRAADPVEITASPPREQLEGQPKRTALADAVDESHRLSKAVPSLSRSESSYNFADAITRGDHHIGQAGDDSQNSSQAVDQNFCDEDIANQSTGALILGVTAILASVEGPASVSSHRISSKDAQESPVSAHRSSLHTSHHATVPTILPTPRSARDKPYTQAGSCGLKIVRPYSTPRVEPPIKCQPSPMTQQSKDPEAPELDVLPNDSKGKYVVNQNQKDVVASRDDSSRTLGRGSSDDAPHRYVAHAEQVVRGFSDSSSRDGIASHSLGDRMTAMSASRQASRETQPEELLAAESFFENATSLSQSASKAANEDAASPASPKLPNSGQKQDKVNAPGLQQVPSGQLRITAGENRSDIFVNGSQKVIESEEGQIFGSADGGKGIQSPLTSFVPVNVQVEPIASSSTQSDDSLLLAATDM